MIKRIFYYAIFLVGFLFVAGTKVAQAVSLPDFSKTSDLPAFISSVYSFALTVVGIAIFIRVLYAGFLMLTAAGNSSKWGDARAKMQNAIVGAILLFAAYLILYVINPDLVKNTFNFSIPSSTSTAPTTGAIKTNATAGPGAISGIILPDEVTSFHGLPIARAQEGAYSFTIKVTDRNGDICRETYNIEVSPNVTAFNAEKRHSIVEKYSASLLNAVNAQEGSGSEIIKTIQSGGCIINTKILPDAIEGIPYYAEIFVAGEAPFVYEIENGILPGGLSILAALDMPILTIKNLTAQRTPSYAFKVGDAFRLDLTNAKPNSDVYFKWFKDGTGWHYPNITPNSEGWSKYGTTDENGAWANQDVFTANEIGTWQEYAMVDGKISRVIEFQILAPEIKIIVSTPAPGTGGVPVYSGGSYGGGGGSCQVDDFCENETTGARTNPLSDAEAQAQSIAIGSSDRCPGGRRVQTCTYSEGSGSSSECDANQFDTRNCYDELNARTREDGTIDTSGLSHSTTGAPPQNVPAGSLYTVDQMSGNVRLGSTNVECRYSDQAAAVGCGNSLSGEYCISDNNAGFNTTWCAGQVDASGKPINPPAATPTPSPAPTSAPRGGTGGSRSR